LRREDYREVKTATEGRRLESCSRRLMFQSWRMEGTRGSTQIFRGKLKRRGGEKEMKSSRKLPPKSGMSEVVEVYEETVMIVHSFYN
jgi:hypothetical protein